MTGLLDITKVFHDAMDKVERSHDASQKLYSAFEGVQAELGESAAPNDSQAFAMRSYIASLRQKMALPDLTSVMNERTAPAIVGPKTSVRDAARLMKEKRTTAVCIVDFASAAGKIGGIFTSKDVVLRVIAAGLDAKRTSVVRVMTPYPETAAPTMTVQDALKKMHGELRSQK